ncbi:MAG: tRNA pseudouridine55 synthase [Clostridiales bacterium]|jgi:tRNA pseudouridine55 synthase|nr:tRNA pseudouridine55 synthase [Clostridiales bacterium]
MDGILNVLKPSGMTSHDVVSYIRKCTRIKKVGHTGTLDPGATGVLPICIGKATKTVELLSDHDKEYRAELKLGIVTDTQDSFGQILSKRKVNISREMLEKVILNFKGTIEQIPPMYSAIKIKGQKLYELARRGIEIERKPRQVKIYDIKIIDVDLVSNTVLLNIRCSKGTYIRTLCFDIGEKLGCGAYMSFLLRTKSGNFTLEESITIDTIEQYSQANKLNELLVPIDEVFSYFPSIIVNADVEKKVVNGNEIPIDLISGRGALEEGVTYRVYNHQDVFLCLSKVIKKPNKRLFLKLVKSFF